MLTPDVPRRSRKDSKKLTLHSAQWKPFFKYMIFCGNSHIAMREIACKQQTTLLGCGHVTSRREPNSAPPATRAGTIHPILARPTVRAILNGACSEAVGGWARPSLRVVDARRDKKSRRASADQGSGPVSGLATTH